MKKIAALGLATAMAVAATAASTDAFAMPYWQNGPYPMMHHHHHNQSGLFFATPFFFGFSFGPRYSLMAPQYSFAGNPHVQWCLAHYRTYNPSTNTFFIKKGVPAVCVSPFWHF